MKKIDSNSKVFLTDDFQKDKYKFGLILKNLSSPDLELYSDEKNYIICRGAKNLPTWIWTKENFDSSKILEIEELIKMFLTDADKDKFICKKELYNLLVERNFESLNLDDYFEMGFLICNKTMKPKECDGILSLPTDADKDILTKYWYDDNQEMNGVGTISIEKAKEEVEELLKLGKFFILRNKEGRIVSMASYSLTDKQAKISHVYTPIEERKKGYAANLIYLITNDILLKGYVPILYTDYNYIPSNKAYINAGYEDAGILINFSCSKQKKKTQSKFR